ncbi:MAG: GntR family transcriptional regulator [Chloroflexota bacterium]|nr:GntR family transcriptional regulator [Chloroflexota bacterium]
MLQPLSPIEGNLKTLSAQVHERIRDAILKRALKPGERIDQNQLADNLGVSIVPVREALKRLEVEGLVSILPRRGAFVTEISLAQMDDLYDARALIEGETVYRAVEHMTDADFVMMQGIIAQMRGMTSAGDVSGFLALNQHFHLHIYSALNNQHLIQIIQNLLDRSELYRYRYMFVTRDVNVIHEEHELILAACRRRDAVAARTAAVLHIQHAQRAIHAYVQGDMD